MRELALRYPTLLERIAHQSSQFPVVEHYQGPITEPPGTCRVMCRSTPS